MQLNTQQRYFEIIPYRYRGNWVFDDEARGLFKEALIRGADKIIDVLTDDIPSAREGFALRFGVKPFKKGNSTLFEWTHAEDGGNWYRNQRLDLEGWLCPALFKYFSVAPSKLYVQVQELPKITYVVGSELEFIRTGKV